MCNHTSVISIGNNMISGAIWCKEARVKFSKTTKLSEPAGRVQLLILEKASQRVETDAILAARALFVICTCVTTLHPSYMKMYSYC